MIATKIEMGLTRLMFVEAPAPSPAPGGPGIDFRNTGPVGNGGITKLDIWKNLAGILMYVGFAATFLAVIAGLIVWGFAGQFLGPHHVNQAKTNILRAGGVAAALGSAGAVWNWLVSA